MFGWERHFHNIDLKHLKHLYVWLCGKLLYINVTSLWNTNWLGSHSILAVMKRLHVDFNIWSYNKKCCLEHSLYVAWNIHYLKVFIHIISKLWGCPMQTVTLITRTNAKPRVLWHTLKAVPVWSAKNMQDLCYFMLFYLFYFDLCLIYLKYLRL